MALRKVLWIQLENGIIYSLMKRQTVLFQVEIYGLKGILIFALMI